MGKRAMLSVFLIVVIIDHCTPANVATETATSTVIVVGAGMSGLSVELGANWVEGVNGNKVNPIWTMANKIGLKTFYSQWNNISANIYKQKYKSGLYNVSVAENNLMNELYEFSRNCSVSLSRHREEDISVLVSQRLNNKIPSTSLEMAIDYFSCDSSFGEPPRVTSLQNTQPLPTYTNFGDDSYFAADSRGYESVVHYIAKEYLKTNKAGEFSEPRLKLNKTEDGEVYKTANVMVSVSIGVLQTNLINFVPDLPYSELLAVYQFDMSIHTKNFLKFPYKFWPTGNGTEFFIYAHEKRGYYTQTGRRPLTEFISPESIPARTTTVTFMGHTWQVLILQTF